MNPVVTMNRILLGLIILGLVSGCGRQAEEAAGSAGRRPVVALVVKTLNNPFFIDMQRGAEEAAQAHGVELLVQAAEREVDVERQMQIIENLIQRRVSALIIAPSGSREIVPAIVKANAAGIPVLVVDTRIDAPALQAAGGRCATFIGSDNEAGGRVAGEFLVAHRLGQARVAILEGIPGHETGDARLRGFRAALVGQGGVTVVASQPANWERDQGYTVFQNILQANPGINALFAANDMMALGAVEAVAASGKAGQVAIIGFDAIDEARQAITRGAMTGTVAQNPSAMGRIAVEWAVKILAGETPPAEVPVSIELVH
jgi:ribose transport system substrate-binding protein